jgi:hypothetical protein
VAFPLLVRKARVALIVVVVVVVVVVDLRPPLRIPWRRRLPHGEQRRWAPGRQHGGEPGRRAGHAHELLDSVRAE